MYISRHRLAGNGAGKHWSLFSALRNVNCLWVVVVWLFWESPAQERTTLAQQTVPGFYQPCYRRRFLLPLQKLMVVFSLLHPSELFRRLLLSLECKIPGSSASYFSFGVQEFQTVFFWFFFFFFVLLPTGLKSPQTRPSPSWFTQKWILETCLCWSCSGKKTPSSAGQTGGLLLHLVFRESEWSQEKLRKSNLFWLL